MQLSASIFLLAIITEQTTDIIKQAVPQIRNGYSRLVSIAIGVLLCVSTRMGVLVELNVPVIYPVVDYVLTGLLISRGSNFLHSLVTLLASVPRKS